MNGVASNNRTPRAGNGGGGGARKKNNSRAGRGGGAPQPRAAANDNKRDEDDTKLNNRRGSHRNGDKQQGGPYNKQQQKEKHLGGDRPSNDGEGFQKPTNGQRKAPFNGKNQSQAAAAAVVNNKTHPTSKGRSGATPATSRGGDISSGDEAVKKARGNARTRKRRREAAAAAAAAAASSNGQPKNSNPKRNGGSKKKNNKAKSHVDNNTTRLTSQSKPLDCQLFLRGTPDDDDESGEELRTFMNEKLQTIWKSIRKTLDGEAAEQKNEDGPESGDAGEANRENHVLVFEGKDDDLLPLPAVCPVISRCRRGTRKDSNLSFCEMETAQDTTDVLRLLGGRPLVYPKHAAVLSIGRPTLYKGGPTSTTVYVMGIPHGVTPLVLRQFLAQELRQNEVAQPHDAMVDPIVHVSLTRRKHGAWLEFANHDYATAALEHLQATKLQMTDGGAVSTDDEQEEEGAAARRRRRYLRFERYNPDANLDAQTVATNHTSGESVAGLEDHADDTIGASVSEEQVVLEEPPPNNDKAVAVDDTMEEADPVAEKQTQGDVDDVDEAEEDEASDRNAGHEEEILFAHDGEGASEHPAIQEDDEEDEEDSENEAYDSSTGVPENLDDGYRGGPSAKDNTTPLSSRTTNSNGVLGAFLMRRTVRTTPRAGDDVDDSASAATTPTVLPSATRQGYRRSGSSGSLVSLASRRAAALKEAKEKLRQAKDNLEKRVKNEIQTLQHVQEQHTVTTEQLQKIRQDLVNTTQELQSVRKEKLEVEHELTESKVQVETLEHQLVNISTQNARLTETVALEQSRREVAEQQVVELMQVLQELRNLHESTDMDTSMFPRGAPEGKSTRRNSSKRSPEALSPNASSSAIRSSLSMDERLETELEFLTSTFCEEEIVLEGSQLTRYLVLSSENEDEAVQIKIVLNIPDGYPNDGILSVQAEVEDPCYNGVCADPDAYEELNNRVAEMLPSMVKACRKEAVACGGSEAIYFVLAAADRWVQDEWQPLE